MGAFAREHGHLPELFTKEKILERFDEFGPFTRWVLPRSQGALSEGRNNRENAVKKVSLEDLIQLRSIETTNNEKNYSHFFLRYVVNRNAHKPTIPYGNRVICLKPSSSKTHNIMIEKYIEKMSTNEIIQTLIQFDKGKLTKEGIIVNSISDNRSKMTIL